MDLDVAAGLAARRRGRTPAQTASASDAGSGPPERACAVSALYAEHALGLVRLAHIMLGSQQAAEDVVQEAFLGLYRRWLQLDDHEKALGYVRSSVLNGCRSVLRSQRTLELDSSHHPPTASAESAVLTAEERREIVQAVRALPDRQREVLALRFYLDLPDEQIAAAMDIRQSTVRSAAHRGLAALRRALGEAP